MPVAGNTFFFSWEVGLMTWLQKSLGQTGIAVLSFFSAFGEETLLILILGFMYWGVDKERGKSVGLSVIMALTWNTVFKNIALRRRPYFDHADIKIHRLVDPSADAYDISSQGYSFPSGHSTNAVSLFGSLAVGLRKKWTTALAAAIPLLVGVSRVAVGAHYPTDVLGGWLLGAAAMLLVPALRKRIKSRALFNGVLLLSVLPGLFYCRSTDYFSSLGLLVGFMAGFAAEEKYVRFENARSPLRVLLRVLGGMAVYFALNTLLKLPFPKDFLSTASLPSLLVRCGRYAVVSFVDFAVYPLVFRLIEKPGARAGKK